MANPSTPCSSSTKPHPINAEERYPEYSPGFQKSRASAEFFLVGSNILVKRISELSNEQFGNASTCLSDQDSCTSSSEYNPIEMVHGYSLKEFWKILSVKPKNPPETPKTLDPEDIKPQEKSDSTNLSDSSDSISITSSSLSTTLSSHENLVCSMIKNNENDIELEFKITIPKSRKLMASACNQSGNIQYQINMNIAIDVHLDDEKVETNMNNDSVNVGTDVNYVNGNVGSKVNGANVITEVNNETGNADSEEEDANVSVGSKVNNDHVKLFNLNDLSAPHFTVDEDSVLAEDSDEDSMPLSLSLSVPSVLEEDFTFTMTIDEQL